MRMLNRFDRPATTTAALGPLTPDAYLRLRRKRARVKVDHLARALVTLADHNRPRLLSAPSEAKQLARFTRMRDTLLLLEQPGSVCRCVDTLNAIASVFGFDPDVYRQLATENAARYPKICRSCGCSGHDACSTDTSVCQWVTPDLCSHCVEDGLRNAQVVA